MVLMAPRQIAPPARPRLRVRLQGIQARKPSKSVVNRFEKALPLGMRMMMRKTWKEPTRILLWKHFLIFSFQATQLVDERGIESWWELAWKSKPKKAPGSRGITPIGFDSKAAFAWKLCWERDNSQQIELSRDRASLGISKIRLSFLSALSIFQLRLQL